VGDLTDLLLGQWFRRHPWWIAGLSEKAIQTGRGHDPQQEQFLVGIRKSVPSIPGNEDCAALFEWVSDIVECKGSVAFEDVERLVHLEVPVDRNACPNRYLLSSECEIGRARGGTGLDENVPGIAEVNEVLTPIGTEHEPLRCGLGRPWSTRQPLTDAKRGSTSKDRPAFYAEVAHDNPPNSATKSAEIYLRYPCSGSRKIAKSQGKIA
jgi:hypothetical protein